MGQDVGVDGPTDVCMYAMGILDEMAQESGLGGIITDEARVRFWRMRLQGYEPDGEELFQVALMFTLTYISKNFKQARDLANTVVWRASPDYKPEIVTKHAE